VKKQPYSALGYHIQLRREQRLLRRRKLARIIGYADGKEGAKAIRLLEEFGTIDPVDLLTRVAVVLHIDDSTILKLQEQDRQAAREWLKRIRKPVKPFLGLRTTPMPCSVEVPCEVAGWGPDAIEQFAAEFARDKRLEVHAVLSWRIRFVFDRCGELLEIREEGRDGFLTDEFGN
jgi:hypothetical protein